MRDLSNAQLALILRREADRLVRQLDAMPVESFRSVGGVAGQREQMLREASRRLTQKQAEEPGKKSSRRNNDPP